MDAKNSTAHRVCGRWHGAGKSVKWSQSSPRQDYLAELAAGQAVGGDDFGQAGIQRPAGEMPSQVFKCFLKMMYTHEIKAGAE